MTIIEFRGDDMEIYNDIENICQLPPHLFIEYISGDMVKHQGILYWLVSGYVKQRYANYLQGSEGALEDVDMLLSIFNPANATLSVSKYLFDCTGNDIAYLLNNRGSFYIKVQKYAELLFGWPETSNRLIFIN
jgi:hypothetical protein